MASTIALSVTDHRSTVTLTLNDPIGPNNTWTADAPGVLSANSGTWNQLTGNGPLNIRGGSPEEIILVIQGVNTYAPVQGQTGTAFITAKVA
jgi:hypothetical protein